MFNKLFKCLAVTMGCVLLAAGTSFAATYSIDASHSTLGFAVKHLAVGTTRGGFTNYSGQIQYDPQDTENFSADVNIEANSIDTKVEARDNHLKSADFFDVENHPTITFTNARLQEQGGGVVIVGDLTMKGVTKTVTIPVSISGPVPSPSGASVIGLAGETTINRQDFGISWSKTLDSGGLVVDDKVTIIVEIEAHSKS